MDTTVKEIVQAAEYTDKDAIACKIILFWTFHFVFSTLDAAKKHHEYLVRQNKPLSDEQRKKTA